MWYNIIINFIIMEEKLSKIIAFSDKTFKSVADIEPLQHLIEEELEFNEVC